MKTVKSCEGGYLVDGGRFVPNCEGSSGYRKVLDWISKGGKVEQSKTEDEISIELEQDRVYQNAARARAYADLVSGSDRYFDEANRKKAQAEVYSKNGETAKADKLFLEADSAVDAGLKRVHEIMLEFPINE